MDEKLSLTGWWSFTTSNGGIHVFKADSVTLLFYPGTKTIDLKGAKEETTRKMFLSLLNENSSEIPDDHVTGENGERHDSHGNDDEEVIILNDRVDAHGNVETIDDKRDTPCSGCARNSQEIHKIWAKLEILERSCQSSKSHQACTSCEALSSRVKELEEERTSLLTTINC